MPDLRGYSRETIRNGSRSFSVAAFIFGRRERQAAYLMYAWCRFCDDRIDHAPSLEAAVKAHKEIEEKTMLAAAGTPSDDPAFQALAAVCRQYTIPRDHLSEFLEGMRMDLGTFYYEDMDSLQLYCYRVAGVVGVMMCHIMGVSDPRALRHAADLGIAMQLTNIARDVLEDLQRGRIYLPSRWIEDAGVPREALMAPAHRRALAAVVAKLLGEAHSRYASGYQGLRYLSLRAAFAVAAAGEIYSSIGTLVLERGPGAWSNRAVVSRAGKLLAVARAVVRVAGLVPSRLVRPWKPVSLQEVES